VQQQYVGEAGKWIIDALQINFVYRWLNIIEIYVESAVKYLSGMRQLAASFSEFRFYYGEC